MEKEQEIESVEQSKTPEEIVVNVNDAEQLAVLGIEGESETSDLVFHLNDFDGPLELLIALVKKNKMEIETVELSKITEQYLELMNEVETLDMDMASEFIEMAATLIEIKSKALLPKAESEEELEDPEELLRQRMLEYEMFKKETQVLMPMQNVNRFYRDPDPKASKFRIVIKDMPLDLLLDAFTKLMTKIHKEEEKIETKEIQKEQFTVAEKIASLKDTLIIRKSVMFSELFALSSCRDEIVTTFMALLELLKMQEIRVSQSENYADIEISKREPEEETVEVEITAEEK